jgi:hypothetical protein
MAAWEKAERFELLWAPASKGLSAALATLHVAFGAAVVAGWIYRIPLLKGERFGTLVEPNTALLFIVAGLGVLASQFSARTPFMGWLVIILGLGIAMFAAATGAQYIAHIDLGIDQVFLRARLSDWTQSGTLPGRMAAPTAVAFTLAGISLAALRGKRLPMVDWTASGVFAI